MEEEKTREMEEKEAKKKEAEIIAKENRIKKYKNPLGLKYEQFKVNLNVFLTK